MYFFDCHGDILSEVKEKHDKGIDIFETYHKPLYEKANALGSVFINFSDPKSKDQKEYFESVNEISLDYFKNDDYYHIVDKTINFDKFNVLFGIEGMNVVELKDIDHLYNLGYRLMGITWNEHNKFAHSHLSEDEGLTKLGKELVIKLNELGVIIDMAHISKKSFMDIANISTKPLVVSHTGMRSLNDISRNIDDEQLLKIKESNGIVGIYAIRKFLKSDGTTTIDDFIDHLEHAINLIGIDHVALGMDFCYYLGDNFASSQVSGIETVAEVSNLIPKLEERGYLVEDIEKIFYKNMLRVINDTL